MQPYTRYRKAQYGQLSTRLDQPSRSRHGLVIFIVLMIGLVWVFTFMNLRAHAAVDEIKSGVSGLCLDDFKGLLTNNAVVDAWGCNDTVAQSWTVTDAAIKHNDRYCLGIQNDGTSIGDHVVLNTCSTAPGQIWLRDQGGYKNPNSGLCLSVPDDQSGVALTTASCDRLSQSSEQWTPLALKGVVTVIHVLVAKVSESPALRFKSGLSGKPVHRTMERF